MIYTKRRCKKKKKKHPDLFEQKMSCSNKRPSGEYPEETEKEREGNNLEKYGITGQSKLQFKKSGGG